MSDTNDQGNSGGRKPLTVVRKTSGTVKQSFSHGRSKQVVVETKKRRPVSSGGGQGGDSGPSTPSASDGMEAKLVALAAKLGITVAELKARQKVLEQRKAEEASRAKDTEAERAAQDRLRTEQERKQQEAREREEAELRRRAEEEAAKLADVASREAVERPSKAPRAAPAAQTPPAADGEADAGRSKRSSGGGASKPARDDRADRAREVATKPSRGDAERRRGKLTIASALGDDADRQRSLASVRRARERERERRVGGGDSNDKTSIEVTLPETITLQDLAQRMNERVADVVKFMFKQGEMLRGNDIVDADMAELIAGEFGHTVRRVSEADVEIGLEGTDDRDEDLQPRAPIVTIMGHVDHGKTSLLDALRKTDVAGGEAGGITQHIGAYQVQLKSGERITFLDTPGHAAFTAMRARGANATDIAILVVAADDSVKPQTIESISHAKAAGVPIVVAITKSDLHDANPEKVLTDLLQYDIQVEAMGGVTQAVKVSAKTGAGLDELTDAISIQAEILELKANPNRQADGVVIESKLDKGRGPVATVLVKRGTLKRGDIVVAGANWGKVRALVDERGQQLADAGPSLPVEVLGLDGAPDPGDAIVVVDSEARAREITEYRIRTKRQVAGNASVAARASLDQLMNRLKDGAIVTSELPIVLKGDVQGSVEAITMSLDKISTEEVRAKVIHGAVGGISESDVLLARSSNAPIFAFNVRANKQARDLAEREGVEIRYYSIIYDLLDDVKATLSGMLAPEKRETFLGYADILEVFNITKVGKVAGCRISEGKVMRGCGVRLLRDNVVIHEGKLKTLKRFKDEVSEVNAGMECGMAFERYDDIRVGDKIECFQVEEIARTLA
ncbi:translation initiation factor IF-2 [Hyphomonas neptunium ATCC 15444]|uniref:Translation initiation factor IF-2 n=2 Tax=Hyphomonas TaxID=85 RepID=IF2_HYPNA|nr:MULTISPECIES: translation initiation factor IF-2 [Hyphomonas]Q0C5Z5.1 RecName: Full=Translation initiation factor IF-2 [Hyphomonas neptunium ATCC 15444]ABI75987.1 translation initiation factor IF-2 [Hyphomonas neptunium ATCC 15444]KCZ94926.1 translation initiation factor IF-2 [Hyphomonas hirschiana VP5]